jgi:hypothetical protein
MSAAEYCEGRDYTAKSLQWWASKLRRPVPSAQQSSVACPPVQLARVVRAPSAPVRSGMVVVHLGGASIEVTNGADRATLAEVFEALRVSSTAGDR